MLHPRKTSFKTLHKSYKPEEEATYRPLATPGYRTIPMGCFIVTCNAKITFSA
jgi:hypothetical protein